ncbi:tetratricopeptide repeat protein [Paenibacillus sp. JJ-223]|uniref:tetratricopeptide repeat protein n=1 Tax=Paenibacillus sp. JJ-223 TaxID=2905647 RepID=UPI001F2876F5|nr:tetratricopeptide repeat protein [Paenibacillus sp. JJ-223]CAH1197031.1 Photosystem I assembly protein Ycf3 [Paenibacillus sp. JJ-223]
MGLITKIKDMSLFKEEDNSANSFILYVALSYFVLIPFALFGAFNNVSFLISFAFSGLFFTLYDMTSKKSGFMLFLGILFTITIPQILQLKAIHRFLNWILTSFNTFFSSEISSTSISNALTIASLGLVLFSLSKKNRKIKEINAENIRLNETIDQQNDWTMKFEQINQLDEIEEQIIALTELIESATDPLILARAYAMRGSALRKNGMLSEALESLNISINLNPGFAQAYNSRGIIYKDKELYDKAIQDYSKAIELNPDYSIAYYNRANVFGKKKLYDKAIQDYSKAIELNPDYSIAYNNRANAFSKKKLFNEALADYNQAIELNSDYSLAYNNRGILFRNMDLYSEALQDYNKAIELKPDFAEPYLGRANLFLKKDLHDEALQDYSKIIELKPDYAEAYFNRGNLFFKKDSYDRALQDYSKAIELKSDYAEAYNNRGYTYRKMNLYEQALQDYKKAFELGAKFPENLPVIIEELKKNIVEAASSLEE